MVLINSYPKVSSAGNLLANTFDPDQAWQNIRPDLVQNVWHPGDIPERCFLENPNFEKYQQTTKHYKYDKLLIMQSVNEFIEKQHILFHLAIETD